MSTSKLNGHAKPAEQPAAEKVGYAFDAKAWEIVSGVAVQLLESTQRAILEHHLRLTNNRVIVDADMQASLIEQVGSLAANQAFATARHFVAHQLIQADRIARADIEAQDSARRAAEGLRRSALGLPPEGTTGDGDDADSGDAEAPRIVAP